MAKVTGVTRTEPPNNIGPNMFQRGSQPAGQAQFCPESAHYHLGENCICNLLFLQQRKAGREMDLH